VSPPATNLSLERLRGWLSGPVHCHGHGRREFRVHQGNGPRYRLWYGKSERDLVPNLLASADVWRVRRHPNHCQHAPLQAHCLRRHALWLDAPSHAVPRHRDPAAELVGFQPMPARLWRDQRGPPATLMGLHLRPPQVSHLVSLPGYGVL
jgi:putative component of toxin-antitoxin plasmid stabilization module